MVLLQPEQATESDAVTLAVQVTDTALAASLGWTPGTGVPAAIIHVHRDRAPDLRSFRTDEDGVVEIGDLPSARYWVWAQRRFDTPAEGAPAVLAGGRLAQLRRGSTEVIHVRGQERGSLVISELYYHAAPLAVTGGLDAYKRQMYVELVNNADTTVYLDGKILGGAFQVNIDISSWPCSETSTWRNDARGIWAQSFQRFPGNGTEYPLAPGQTAVVAEQAIDHSAIYPGLPDLRRADFQFYWEDRAMNPDVPTMLPVQLRHTTSQVMGIAFWVPFVADVPDLDALERGENLQGTFALFPRDRILDLAQIVGERYTLYDWTAPTCGNLVGYPIDALLSFTGPDRLRPDAHLLAAQRKVLPDGTLQRTGVSAADWEIRERSPGMIR
ncbi:MAG: hypothetical protein ACQERF_11910 [Actinomycetota bacterium]